MGQCASVRVAVGCRFDRPRSRVDRPRPRCRRHHLVAQRRPSRSRRWCCSQRSPAAPCRPARRRSCLLPRRGAHSQQPNVCSCERCPWARAHSPALRSPRSMARRHRTASRSSSIFRRLPIATTVLRSSLNPAAPEIMPPWLMGHVAPFAGGVRRRARGFAVTFGNPW